MRPKEKYDQLKKLFKGYSIVALDRDEEEVEWEKSENYFADQCVQICVDEIVAQIKGTPDYGLKEQHLEYWKEVKGYAKM